MVLLTIFLNLSPQHIFVVLIVVLLLFGGKKIPELMKGLGSGINEFKKAAKGEEQPANSKKEEEEEKK